LIRIALVTTARMGDEEDLETFIANNNVDEEAANLLRACDLEVQAKVMARGGCAECRHPGGVIKKRIKDAENVGSSVYSQEVEEFISTHNLDERAMEVLRTADPEVQRIVLDRGDCTDAANPSAMILSRVKNAVRDRGKGKGSSSKGKQRNDYGGCDDAWGFDGYDSWGGKGGFGMGGWGGGMYGKGMYGMDAWGGMPRKGFGGLGPGGGFGGGYGGGFGGGFGLGSFAQEVEQIRQKKARGEEVEQTWHKKARKEPKVEQVSAASGPNPTVHWLTCADDSPLLQEYAAEGPALFFDKQQSVFQNASYVLSEVVSALDHVDVEHDPDWKLYPELGEQFKLATGEENCFALAKSKKHGKWGAGFHAGKKGRESAAKLALAVAISAGTEREAQLCSHYPDFARMISGDAGDGTAAPPAIKYTPAPKPQQGTTPLVYPMAVSGDGAIASRGLPLEGCAMVYDKKFVDAFSNGAHILESLLSGMPTEIVHDTDWDKFPDVGQALLPCGVEENCYAVGICPTLGKWAIGVGANWKAREHSVKLALAVAVAWESPHYAMTAAHFPVFDGICQSVESGGQAALEESGIESGGLV